MLALTLTACNNNSDNSSLTPDDADPDTNPGNTGQPDTDPSPVATLMAPDYKGELTFSDIMTVDLESFLAEAGLHSVNAYSSLARDGKHVRLDITNDEGVVTAIAAVDTETGVLSWLLTDISPTTRILFDGNNEPVASVGIACQPTAYTSMFDNKLMDISLVIPEGRCISVSPKLSANGNVMIFNAYDPQVGTEYLAPDQVQYAYTLDSDNLVELAIDDLQRNGTTLSARTLYLHSQDSYLSDDGAQYFAKAWWEGTDETGGTVREVGAVLWDTATRAAQTRGLSPDLRGCTITEKISCVPPYSYAMSSDGSVQYSEVPTDQLFNPTSGSPFTTFSTVVEQTGTAIPAPIVLPGVMDGNPVATNHDGSLLLLHSLRTTDSMPASYNLYHPDTGTYVSLNRALNACPEKDESGNTIDADSCQFTSVPASITNDGESFTADGTSVLIRSVSRTNASGDQVVESFILDVDTGSLYSLPDNFSSDMNRINADASVFVGQSNFPEYDLLIGRR